LVYRDLRRLAQKYLADEYRGHTLQATALVHELYLRLSSYQEVDWRGRGQFIAVAAQTMRRILIDHARKRRAAKRDGTPPMAAIAGTVFDADVLDVDRALKKLAADYPRHARVVELRFFGGLDAPEIAQIMDLSCGPLNEIGNFVRHGYSMNSRDLEPHGSKSDAERVELNYGRAILRLERIEEKTGDNKERCNRLKTMLDVLQYQARAPLTLAAIQELEEMRREARNCLS
jgi:RNA polymerase sigma factor (TIGR02999 family)